MLSSNLWGRLGFDGLLKRKYKACGVGCLSAKKCLNANYNTSLVAA